MNPIHGLYLMQPLMYGSLSSIPSSLDISDQSDYVQKKLDQNIDGDYTAT